MKVVAFCFLLISSAIAQALEFQPVPDKQLPYRESRPTRFLAPFFNVCCSECSRYNGNQRLGCYSQCQTVCHSENTCAGAGQGVYAGWCSTVCGQGFARSSARPLSLRQCAGACAGQVQSLCFRGCNDLYPNCNAISVCHLQVRIAIFLDLMHETTNVDLIISKKCQIDGPHSIGKDR